MPKPIQSRHGLTRCTACRAHIRAADRPSATVCPFCGANLRTGRPLISLPSGRGGLLAASLLAFGAAGCGGTGTDTSNEPAITAEPTASDDPAGGTAQGPNQNQPEDDPGYDDPVDDPVAVEAYGAPPPEDDPSVDPPADEEPQADDDSFRPRPSDEHRPAPRYGLAPGRRPGRDRPDPFGGVDL